MSELQPIRTAATQNIHDNRASELGRHIIDEIREYDAALDPEYEVGVRLVSFGQAVVFHLEGMKYANPSLILFSGTTDSGEPVELIQHVSQISILLTKLHRRQPETPKRPIGFLPVSGEDSSA
jgi:hypothetical protein